MTENQSMETDHSDKLGMELKAIRERLEKLEQRSPEIPAETIEAALAKHPDIASFRDFFYKWGNR